MIKTIAWDLDDCLANTAEHLLRQLRQHYHLPPEVSLQHMRRPCVDESFPRHVCKAWIDRVFRDGAFWASIPPHEPLLTAALLAQQSGVRNLIVTARSLDQHWLLDALTQDWLVEQGLTRADYVLIPREQKPLFAGTADVGVEDRADNANALAAAGIPCFLLAQTYNHPEVSGIGLDPLVLRVRAPEAAQALRHLVRGSLTVAELLERRSLVCLN